MRRLPQVDTYSLGERRGCMSIRLLVLNNYQRLDTRAKAVMDAVRIAARIRLRPEATARQEAPPTLPGPVAAKTSMWEGAPSRDQAAVSSHSVK